MTQPYTDNDLREQAASHLNACAEDFDFVGIGEAMQDEKPWSTLTEDDFDTAQRKIDDLLGNAPGLGTWAVDMGADGLAPHAVALTVLGDDRPLARVHFAFDPNMPKAARNAFVMALGEAANASL